MLMAIDDYGSGNKGISDSFNFSLRFRCLMSTATFRNDQLSVLKTTMQYLRDKRNQKLLISDWTQMPDSPLTDSKNKSGQITDNNLEICLDLTQTKTKFTDIFFPTKPD
ncbi:MAG: hypothetical protein CM15mV144_260 [Caudoviricetes sp.]|nr:MAG: hypothetical protein CM15mV144_260 [Caudoviricetes sp.]